MLLTLALILGTIGDAFLAWHGPRNFLGGLGAFLLGHLAYVGLLTGVSGGLGLLTQEPWRMGLVVGLVVATGFCHRLSMRLDIDSLRAFRAIVESGSFTGAASRLYLTQSAVSWKIKRLEERLGHTLLVRKGTFEAYKAFLTEIGYLQPEGGDFPTHLWIPR